MIEIYPPLEDSFFFADFLNRYLSKKKNKNIKYLDMGCGSGILSEEALKFLKKENILSVDINQEAVNLTTKKGFNAIKSDLFNKVYGKFNLITFNAPYLPMDSREPLDSQKSTTGGKKGDEITIKFLNQAFEHLSEKGDILLLISSLTPLNKIKKFDGKIVAKKKLFFEELNIYRFNKKQDKTT